MRSRAARDKMVKRVKPRWPFYWVVPEHLVLDPARLDEEMRDAVRRCKPPHGCDVSLTLLRDHEAWPGTRYDFVVRIDPLPRRDTSHTTVARWLSETPERTP